MPIKGARRFRRPFSRRNNYIDVAAAVTLRDYDPPNRPVSSYIVRARSMSPGSRRPRPKSTYTRRPKDRNDDDEEKDATLEDVDSLQDLLKTQVTEIAEELELQPIPEASINNLTFGSRLYAFDDVRGKYCACSLIFATRSNNSEACVVFEHKPREMRTFDLSSLRVHKFEQQDELEKDHELQRRREEQASKEREGLRQWSHHLLSEEEKLEEQMSGIYSLSARGDKSYSLCYYMHQALFTGRLQDFYQLYQEMITKGKALSMTIIDELELPPTQRKYHPIRLTTGEYLIDGIHLRLTNDEVHMLVGDDVCEYSGRMDPRDDLAGKAASFELKAISELLSISQAKAMERVAHPNVMSLLYPIHHEDLDKNNKSHDNYHNNSNGINDPVDPSSDFRQVFASPQALVRYAGRTMIIQVAIPTKHAQMVYGGDFGNDCSFIDKDTLLMNFLQEFNSKYFMCSHFINDTTRHGLPVEAYTASNVQGFADYYGHRFLTNLNRIWPIESPNICKHLKWSSQTMKLRKFRPELLQKLTNGVQTNNAFLFPLSSDAYGPDNTQVVDAGFFSNRSEHVTSYLLEEAIDQTIQDIFKVVETNYKEDKPERLFQVLQPLVAVFPWLEDHRRLLCESLPHDNLSTSSRNLSRCAAYLQAMLEGNPSFGSHTLVNALWESPDKLRALLDEECLPWWKETDLAQILHKRGVPLRHMGLLRERILLKIQQGEQAHASAERNNFDNSHENKYDDKIGDDAEVDDDQDCASQRLFGPQGVADAIVREMTRRSIKRLFRQMLCCRDEDQTIDQIVLELLANVGYHLCYHSEDGDHNNNNNNNNNNHNNHNINLRTSNDKKMKKLTDRLAQERVANDYWQVKIAKELRQGYGKCATQGIDLSKLRVSLKPFIKDMVHYALETNGLVPAETMLKLTDTLPKSDPDLKLVQVAPNIKAMSIIKPMQAVHLVSTAIARFQSVSASLSSSNSDDKIDRYDDTKIEDLKNRQGEAASWEMPEEHKKIINRCKENAIEYATANPGNQLAKKVAALLDFEFDRNNPRRTAIAVVDWISRKKKLEYTFRVSRELHNWSLDTTAIKEEKTPERGPNSSDDDDDDDYSVVTFTDGNIEEQVFIDKEGTEEDLIDSLAGTFGDDKTPHFVLVSNQCLRLDPVRLFPILTSGQTYKLLFISSNAGNDGNDGDDDDFLVVKFTDGSLTEDIFIEKEGTEADLRDSLDGVFGTVVPSFVLVDGDRIILDPAVLFHLLTSGQTYQVVMPEMESVRTLKQARDRAVAKRLQGHTQFTEFPTIQVPEMLQVVSSFCGLEAIATMAVLMNRPTALNCILHFELGRDADFDIQPLVWLAMAPNYEKCLDVLLRNGATQPHHIPAEWAPAVSYKTDPDQQAQHSIYIPLKCLFHKAIELDDARLAEACLNVCYDSKDRVLELLYCNHSVQTADSTNDDGKHPTLGSALTRAAKHGSNACIDMLSQFSRGYPHSQDLVDFMYEGVGEENMLALHAAAQYCREVSLNLLISGTDFMKSYSSSRLSMALGYAFSGPYAALSDAELEKIFGAPDQEETATKVNMFCSRQIAIAAQIDEMDETGVDLEQCSSSLVHAAVKWSLKLWSKYDNQKLLLALFHYLDCQDGGIHQMLLEPLIEAGEYEKLEKLLDLGVDPQLLWSNGLTPLIFNATLVHPNAPLCARSLLEADADVDAVAKNDHTALTMAVHCSNPLMVEFLLEAEADADIVRDIDSGTTLLMEAVVPALTDAGLKVFELLIEHGADVHATDAYGATVLHHLAVADMTSITDKQGNPLDNALLHVNIPQRVSHIVDLLLEARLDLNIVNNDGAGALRVAVTSPFSLGSQVAGALLDSRVSVRDDCPDSVLFSAVEHGNADCVEILCKFEEVDIEARNQLEQTALLRAVQLADSACVAALVDLKANLEAVGSDGLSPLLLAAQQANVQIFTYLLEKGANLAATKQGTDRNVIDVTRSNPEVSPDMYNALKQCNAFEKAAFNEDMQTALHWLVADDEEEEKDDEDEDDDADDRQESKKEKRKRGGKHGNIRDTHLWHLVHVVGLDLEAENMAGFTPFLLACQEGSVSLISQFLQLQNPSVNSRAVGAFQRTALHFLVENRHKNVCQTMIPIVLDRQRGEDLFGGDPIEMKDQHGRTALAHAAMVGSVEGVKTLIGLGAEIKTQDNDGLAAVQLAELKKHKLCAKILKFGLEAVQDTGDPFEGQSLFDQ